MAEILGLAASVIAVVDMTGKVGSASFKLMRLWNEVKEVPDMLLQKVERIRDLEEFLDDTESQIARSLVPEEVCNMSRLQKHVSKARGALTDVQEMVDHLQAKIDADQRGLRRRFASTKVLLRKDEWNALDKKLDSALYLFSIAQTRCLMAMSTFCTTFMLEEQPRLTKVTAQLLTENDYPSEMNDKNSARRRRPNYTHSTVSNVFHMPYSDSLLPTFRFGFGANSSFQFSVRTPTWLTGSVYSILAQRSFQGWQLNLRAHEVVKHYDEELLDCFLRDDALGLFRYLDEHKLTPYVRDEQDFNMLWYTVFLGAFSSTKLLLERGLASYLCDPIFGENSDLLVFHLIWLLYSFSSEPRDLAFLELFADHGLEVVCDDMRMLSQSLSLGISYPAFRYILKCYGSKYHLLHVGIRLQHLKRLAESGGCWSPDEILLIIPEAKDLTAQIVELSVEEDAALLNSFAFLYSRRLVEKVHHPGGELRLEEKKQWKKLIESCIRQDALSLHRLESAWFRGYGHSEASPFSSILWSLIVRKDYGCISATRLAAMLDSVLTAWTALLSDCDVDLLGYGRQERQLYQNGFTQYGRRWAPWASRAKGIARFSLTGFTYGSRPEQWRFWWTLEYEDFSGEFWDLAESQAFNMPGSWVDEPWDLDDYESEVIDRYSTWGEEETTPLVWSEFRKIRPPI